jgi:anti-anti-sigma regulatory factor
MRPRRPSAIVCDVGALPADATAVDRLARLQLAARRAGAEVQLRNLSRELEELLELAGLGDVLRVEVKRQPEDGEERGRIEEERELADPPL